jgi:hypothetical protein
VYTGFQLPYDPHEWDYNSWYDTGHEGTPSPKWYYEASRHQRERHNYRHVSACGGCAMREICDGFHAQYVARWGGAEAVPYPGPVVTDPCHFVCHQDKHDYLAAASAPPARHDHPSAGGHPAVSPLDLAASGGAGARHTRPGR